MPKSLCQDARLLLPWHVAGTLDEHDLAVVEHHLSACVACRTELAEERLLAAAVSADEPDVGNGWKALSVSLDRSEALPPERVRREHRRRWAPWRVLAAPRTLRWVAGGQFAALLVIGTMAVLPGERDGAYRALGDAATPRRGNTLVMFRPEASEAAIRGALTASHARLVDGPTAVGAYLLDVPRGKQGRALVRLRANASVTMAEPVDSGQAE